MWTKLANIKVNEHGHNRCSVCEDVQRDCCHRCAFALLTGKKIIDPLLIVDIEFCRTNTSSGSITYSLSWLAASKHSLNNQRIIRHNMHYLMQCVIHISNLTVQYTANTPRVKNVAATSSAPCHCAPLIISLPAFFLRKGRSSSIGLLLLTNHLTRMYRLRVMWVEVYAGDSQSYGIFAFPLPLWGSFMMLTSWQETLIPEWLSLQYMVHLVNFVDRAWYRKGAYKISNFNCICHSSLDIQYFL